MEFKFILVMVLFIYDLYETQTAEVHMNEDIRNELGSNDTVLECSFVVPVLIGVEILAKDLTSNDYKKIAAFITAGNLVNLTEDGQYLRDRVTLSDVFQTSKSVKITFRELLCIDERDYKCTVRYYDADFKNTNSSPTNITVIVPPVKPNNLLLIIKSNEKPSTSLSTETTAFLNESTTVPSSSEPIEYGEFMFSNITLAEGDIVIFFCTGNVGKPTRNFLWQKIDQTGHLTDYTNVSTTFQHVFGECYYNGISEFTHTITAEDNEAIISCLVENMPELNSTTEPLEVHYKVRKPIITKNPDQYMYGKETTTLILNCSADGNPQPSILWKKGGEMVGEMSMFEITNLTTNKSGIYECFANNSVRNVTYEESSSVNITVVEETITTTPAPTEKTTHSSPETVTSQKKESQTIIYVVVPVVVAVVIPIVIVGIACMFRIRKRKSEADSSIQNNKTYKNKFEAYSSIALDDKSKEDETKGNTYADNKVHNMAYLKHEEDIKWTEKNSSDQSNVYAVVNKPKNITPDKEGTGIEDPYALDQEGVYDKAYDRRHKPDENSESFDTSTDKTRQSNLQKNTNEHEQFKETTGDRSSYVNKAFSDYTIKEKGKENESSTETTAENNSYVKTSL